jgi:predicted transcriptional regulator
MNQKRDRLGIIHDILKVIEKKGSSRRTTIMYQANLSHEMLTEYMNDLIAKGMIKEEISKGGVRIYSLQDKGKSFLSEYSSIKNFLESYGLSEK